MGQGEWHAEFARGFDQIGGFLEIDAQRFLAEHGDARVHRLHGRIKVNKIGGDDEDVVELLVGGRLRVGGDHFVIGSVAFDRIGPIGGFLERDLGIREQRAGDDPAGAIHEDGFLMGMNDEGAFAASDQTDVEWFVRHGGGCG